MPQKEWRHNERCQGRQGHPSSPHSKSADAIGYQPRPALTMGNTFVRSHSLQNQSPTGTSCNGGSRQDKCQGASHPSQRIVSSGFRWLPHLTHGASSWKTKSIWKAGVAACDRKALNDDVQWYHVPPHTTQHQKDKEQPPLATTTPHRPGQAPNSGAQGTAKGNLSPSPRRRKHTADASRRPSMSAVAAALHYLLSLLLSDDMFHCTCRKHDLVQPPGTMSFPKFCPEGLNEMPWGLGIGRAYLFHIRVSRQKIIRINLFLDAKIALRNGIGFDEALHSPLCVDLQRKDVCGVACVRGRRSLCGSNKGAQGARRVKPRRESMALPERFARAIVCTL